MLITFLIVCIVKFIDRIILTVLAKDIKANLGITDAQMVSPDGVVFAVFNAVVGISLGRLYFISF